MARERRTNFMSQVPVQAPKRSFFALDHSVKMSGKFGWLYPVLMMECLPGDVVNDQMTCFARLAPQLFPTMHPMHITTHFFHVPCNIITNHWESFITGGQEGTEAPVLPFITPAALYEESGNNADLMRKGTLWDYLGLPVFEGAAPGTWSGEQISVLPFRAYAKVFNDWYRDPNLGVELALDLDAEGQTTEGSYVAGLFSLRSRGWMKDFYTACLSWAQRGAEVLMPLAGTGSVAYKDVSELYYAGPGPGIMPASGELGGDGVSRDLLLGVGNVIAPDGLPGRVENIDSVDIDASSVSINDLRLALAVQRFLENNARGGGRYVEQTLARFGVRIPDFRLQRSEYLGGGKQVINISEVLATAENEQTEVPVGDMAGHGVSMGKSNRFSYECKEHGYIIGIMSVTFPTSYAQGLHRMWTRKTHFDYATPELAHLGEQEIFSKELFYSFDSTQANANNTAFGYLPRYAEYKFMNDRYSGDFRDSLLPLHLGRKFTSRPVLDTEFTTLFENGAGNEETFRRIFANQDGTDYVWFELYHKLGVNRPLPYFGVPQII